MAGIKCQAREKKASPCVWGTPQIWISNLLPETPCISESIWYNVIDPGEQTFEEIPILRILYRQRRWKKSVDSVTSCC